MRLFFLLLIICFIIQSCCKNDFFTQDQIFFIPDRKYFDTIIFQKDVYYDTLFLKSFKRDTIECNPIETTKFNREDILFLMSNNNAKSSEFHGSFSLTTKDNKTTETPRVSLYNKMAHLEKSIQIEDDVFGTCFLIEKNKRRYKGSKEINSFLWSKKYGYIKYTDKDDNVWFRIGIETN